MKKIICAVLVAVMLASLCACGGDFVGGGDTFTVDYAEVHGLASLRSYSVWEVDLQVQGVYETRNSYRKLDIAIDLSEYSNGAYVIVNIKEGVVPYYNFDAYDEETHSLWSMVEIESQSYYVEFLIDIKRKIDFSISVKDMRENYELVYYSYNSNSIKDEYKGNFGYIYNDLDGVSEAFSKHSIIMEKENVVL